MAEDVHGVQDVPAVKALKDARPSRIASLRAQMESAASSDVREEGKDLRDAADHSPNVIIDLTLDGHIRWVSPSWPDIIGTDIDSIQGKPMSDILVDDKSVFHNATQLLQHNDAGSRVIRFSVFMGPASVLRRHKSHDQDLIEDDVTDEDDNDPRTLNLEAQGILVFDRSTGQESHV